MVGGKAEGTQAPPLPGFMVLHFQNQSRAHLSDSPRWVFVHHDNNKENPVPSIAGESLISFSGEYYLNFKAVHIANLSGDFVKRSKISVSHLYFVPADRFSQNVFVVLIKCECGGGGTCEYRCPRSSGRVWSLQDLVGFTAWVLGIQSSPSRYSLLIAEPSLQPLCQVG